jgi:hypothetical protein
MRVEAFRPWQTWQRPTLPSLEALTQLGQRFGLSTELGSGVWCGENGVFVGSVPLLERGSSQSGPDHWQPRPVSELNRDLSECFDLPIEFTPKISGLTSASGALNRGDLLHAQIATMHLQIPDPPTLTKSPPNAEETIDLARQLLWRRVCSGRHRPAGHSSADYNSSSVGTSRHDSLSLGNPASSGRPGHQPP